MGDGGQSTVEFAVIAAGLISVSVALGLLWHVFGDGLVLQHVLAAASHHLQASPAPFVADIFRY